MKKTKLFCKKKHRLYLSENYEADWICDACDSIIPKGSQIPSCGRCDYALCKACEIKKTQLIEDKKKDENVGRKKSLRTKINRTSTDTE